MKTIRWAVLLLALGALCPAWSGLADEKPDPIKKSLPADVRLKTFEQLEAKPDEMQEKLIPEYTQYYRTKENKTEAEARQLALGSSYIATLKLRSESAEKALRLADEKPADAVALRCYVYAITNGSEALQKQALALLEQFGATSPDLLPFLRLWNPRGCGELYANAAARHPNSVVRAHATFYLARSRQNDLFRLPPPDHLDARLKELDAGLMQLEKEFAKTAWIEDPKQTLGAVIAGDRQRIAIVAPGRTAPAFAGKLLDGSAFRLADQRGKVVVLSFWFATCGPCAALVPDEVKLTAQYTGRPFLLVGVNSDSLEVGRKAAAQRGMTWPQFAQGQTAPVSKAYWTTAAPSVCVIDAKGMIRYWSDGGGQAMRTQEFQTLLDTLVKEAERK